MDRDELGNFLKHKRAGLHPEDVGLHGTQRRRTPGLRREEVDAPAQIVSDLGVTLVQNRMAEALIGVQTQFSGLRRSNIYRWFTDPVQREIHPPEDHVEHSRIFAASLRAVHAGPGEDPEADHLVSALLGESAEFAELWGRHEVRSRAHASKRFVHPEVGVLTRDPAFLKRRPG